MDKLDIVSVCKLTATAAAGLFTGSSLYASVVQVPALMTVKDIVSLRQDWKITFLRGAKLQPSLSLISTATSGTAAYFTEGDERTMWLVGMGAILCIMPYTGLVMLKDIKTLLQDDVIQQRGESFVREGIMTWEKRHRFRTLAGMAAFSIFLYTLYKK